MARALAEAGASVVLTSRDRTRTERVAAELEGHAVDIELDVRDEAAEGMGLEQIVGVLTASPAASRILSALTWTPLRRAECGQIVGGIHVVSRRAPVYRSGRWE
jgi:NAD(P)-dependent dehydrogenase (short-subunit alcohol dehydrogenase family)